MPPGASSRGSVLDRALATPAPQTTRGGNFFQALKPNSSLFQQTSRVNVARPAAQTTRNARVVPKAKPTVVVKTPAQVRAEQPKPSHSFLDRAFEDAKGAASSLGSNVAHHTVRSALEASTYVNPVTQVGAVVAHAPGVTSTLDRATRAGNDITSAIASHLTPHVQGPSVGGGASTAGAIANAEDLLNAYRTSPVANISLALQNRLRNAAAFLSAQPGLHYDVPNIGIVSPKEKKSAGLPETATDEQFYRKTFSMFHGKPGYFEQLLGNIPGGLASSVFSPVAVADIASHAGEGDYAPATEFARENFQFAKSMIPGVGHPLATLRDQPVPFITSLLGAGRLAGGLAGTAARTGAVDAAMARLPGAVGEAGRAGAASNYLTPSARMVTPAGLEDRAAQINRGMSSPKLDERLIQSLSDRLASTSKIAGRRVEHKAAIATEKQVAREEGALYREHVEPAARDLAKLSGSRQEVATYYAGQHFRSMAQAEDYYRRLVEDQRAKVAAEPDDPTQADHLAHLEQRLARTQRLRKKVGDTPFAEMTDHKGRKILSARENAAAASRFAEERMGQMQRGTGSAARRIASAQEAQRPIRLRSGKVASGPLREPQPFLADSTAQRSAYMPTAEIQHVLGSSEAATRLVQANDRVNELARDPEQNAAALRTARVEREQALHAFRAQERDATGAPPVAPGSPLDRHDPLFFDDVRLTARGLSRFFGKKGGSTMNPRAEPKLVGRAGVKGYSRTGRGTLNLGSSDPSIFTHGVARPLEVARQLHAFREHAKFMVEAKPGQRYDTTHWVDLTRPDANVPVRPDADPESLRSQLIGHFSGTPKGRIATIRPDDGLQHYLVPRARAEVMKGDIARMPGPTVRALMHTTGVWRWLTLATRPAWLVNNAVGNIGMAMLGGANPADFGRALRGQGDVPGVRNRGQFAQFTHDGGLTIRHPLRSFNNIVIGANVAIENLSRQALAVHSLRRSAKGEVHGAVGSIAQTWSRSNDAVREAIAHPSPEAQARAITHVNRFLGDFERVASRRNVAADVLVPFHRWYSFIMRFTVEMPVRTPGRALLLQRLGQFGQNIQQQESQGFLPSSMAGAIPISNPILKAIFGGSNIRTQGLDPLATAWQLYSPQGGTEVNAKRPSAEGVLGAVNPLISALFSGATGIDPSYADDPVIKDAAGNAVGPMNWRVAVHNLEGSVPFLTAWQGYNTSPTSINPISPERTHAGPLSQTQQDFLGRLRTYLGASGRNYDWAKRDIQGVKTEVKNLRADAKARLAAKH